MLYFLNGFSGELSVTAIAKIIVPTIKISGAKIQKSFFINNLISRTGLFFRSKLIKINIIITRATKAHKK